MKTIIQNFVLITILVCSYSPINAQNGLYLMAAITGGEIGDRVGGVEWVGDVNGDGFDDVLINTIRGSWSYYSLYHGGAPFDTVADVELTQGRASGAGDVNADGYNDILVEKLKFPKEDPYDGRLYVYLGGPDSLTLSDFEFADDYRFCPAGVGKVGGIGDVNKDGFDDFIYSSVYNWCDGMARVFLFLGGDTLDSKHKLTFMTNRLGDDFGRGGGGGDVNGDGYDDLIIGAPIGPGGMEYDTSKVMIYYGGPEMDSVADEIITIHDHNFGKTIVNAGDLDGEGESYFFISSLESVYLYQGDLLKYVIKAGHTMGLGGYVNAVAGGDINNDGFGDFIIGNTNYRNVDSVMTGAAWVYLGGANLDTLHDFSMEGETKWSEFSKCMSLVGDLNGDGYDEIVVGAPNFPDYQNPKGKVYIYSTQSISSVHQPLNGNSQYFDLFQNYPNPFNARTKIDFSLDRSTSVHLVVYNHLGQIIQTLIKGRLDKGRHSIIWDAAGLPSGIYFCRIEAETESETIKLLLIK